MMWGYATFSSLQARSVGISSGRRGDATLSLGDFVILRPQAIQQSSKKWTKRAYQALNVGHSHRLKFDDGLSSSLAARAGAITIS
jgi:hypothetical protein